MAVNKFGLERACFASLNTLKLKKKCPSAFRSVSRRCVFTGYDGQHFVKNAVGALASVARLAQMWLRYADDRIFVTGDGRGARKIVMTPLWGD